MTLVSEHPSHKAWRRELQQHDDAIAAYRENERATSIPTRRPSPCGRPRLARLPPRARRHPSVRSLPVSRYPTDMLLTLTQARQRHIADETKVLRAIADVVVERGFEREPRSGSRPVR